jgi:DNA-binding NarL/FixJ family response regulator
MTLDLTLDRRMARGAGDVRYTEREFFILCLIAEGLTNIETARRLHISRQSVALHIAQMLRATGARSRTELVARAYCNGVLPIGIWPPALSLRLR